MRVIASTNPFGIEPQAMETTALVSRMTGQVIGLGRADPYGPRVFFDLDRVFPARRLCSPIQRTEIGLFRDDTKYAPITYVDRWVLTENLEDAAKSTLQRCGRRKPERIAVGFRGIALGKGLIAYTSNRARGRSSCARSLRRERGARDGCATARAAAGTPRASRWPVATSSLACPRREDPPGRGSMKRAA